MTFNFQRFKLTPHGLVVHRGAWHHCHFGGSRSSSFVVCPSATLPRPGASSNAFPSAAASSWDAPLSSRSRVLELPGKMISLGYTARSCWTFPCRRRHHHQLLLLQCIEWVQQRWKRELSSQWQAKTTPTTDDERSKCLWAVLWRPITLWEVHWAIDRPTNNRLLLSLPWFATYSIYTAIQQQPGTAVCTPKRVNKSLTVWLQNWTTSIIINSGGLFRLPLFLRAPKCGLRCEWCPSVRHSRGARDKSEWGWASF